MTRPPHRRAGLASLLLLLLLPGLVLFVFLVLSIDRQRVATAELRNAGVSASLAAAAELATDDLLTADPDRLKPLLEAARNRAGKVAAANAAGGKPVDLPEVDVEFGHADRSFGGTFTRFDPTDPKADWGKLNAVEVATHLAANAKTVTRVRAMFDTAVTGFRPTATRPVPLSPFALLNDPTQDASWTNAVARGRAAAPRTLATVVVVVGLPPAETPPPIPVFPLDIGAGRFSSPPARVNHLIGQIGVGVRTEDVAGGGFGGGFSLRPDDARKPVAAEAVAASDLEAVAAAFRKVIGEARVWPLFAVAVTESGAGGEPVTVVSVNGFVAARLLQVEYATGDTGVRLTLREAVLATPTAITQPAPRDGVRVPPPQRSVGKVRLAG